MSNKDPDISNFSNESTEADPLTDFMIAEWRNQKLPTCLDLERPVRLSVYGKTLYPGGSTDDAEELREFITIADKVTEGYRLLDRKRLELNKAAEDAKKQLLHHIDRYRVQKKQEDLEPDDEDIEGNDLKDFVEETLTAPNIPISVGGDLETQGASDDWAEETKTKLQKLLRQLQDSQRDENNKEWIRFYMYVLLLKDCLHLGVEYSKGLFASAISDKKRFLGHIPQVERLIKDARARILAKKQQLTCIGVIGFMEDEVFPRLKNFSAVFDAERERRKSDDSMLSEEDQIRSAKWSAALLISSTLSAAFWNQLYQQRCYGNDGDADAWLFLAHLPEIVVSTLKLLNKPQPTKPFNLGEGKEYLLIEAPVVGPEGRILLLGISHYLNITHLQNYGRLFNSD